MNGAVTRLQEVVAATGTQHDLASIGQTTSRRQYLFLCRLDIADARVSVVDKGALECTLKARLECAAFRAAGTEPDATFPWGGAIR